MPRFNTMNSNSKSNSKYLNLILKYLPCLIKGLLFTVVGILVLSFAYYKMSTHSNVFYYLNYLFIAFGAFVTGNATYHKLGGRGIVSGTLGAIPIMLLDMILIFIFSFNVISAFLLLIVPLCILFGAIGGIVGSNAKKRY